jgi:glycosyltransferase involved in cell wall biosynthesis
MRVLYLTADPGVPVLGHKGASVHVREMARALEQLSAEVTIASPRIEFEGAALDWRGRLISIPPILPKRHQNRASLEWAIARQAAYLHGVARALGVQAIYERFSLFSAAGVRAAAALGIPHLLELNAPLREEAARFRQLPFPEAAAAVEQEVLRAANVILPVSQALADWAHDQGATAPIEVVGNGVDAALFPEPPRPRTDRLVVGFAGSLKPWHGIDVMLDACRTALQAHSQLSLEVVGDGPMRAALAAAGLPAERFRHVGAVDHARAVEHIRQWHVGLAPYHDVPGFYFSPLKVLEYMAAGLCTVASDLGQIRELIGKGDRGILVPAGNAAAIAAALGRLATDPEEARRRGTLARAYVLRHHTWAQNAVQVLTCARALCERSAA